MRLSILIPTLIKRKDMFNILLDNLIKQMGDFEIYLNPTHNVKIFKGAVVEILAYSDNKEHSTGYKRNHLLHISEGDYVVFVDDDDIVYDYYISEILKAIQSNPDCVGIKGLMTTNGHNEIGWELSKDFQNITTTRDGKPFYLRTTNHISPVRRDIALTIGFPDKSNAEDKAYSVGINPFLKTEVKIDLPMYHYKYISTNKEY